MMNTVVAPVLLLAFVYGAWACNGTDADVVEGTDSATKAFNDEVRSRAKASMRGAHALPFLVTLVSLLLTVGYECPQAITTSYSFCAVSQFLVFN